jgi:hypothetical protein
VKSPGFLLSWTAIAAAGFAVLVERGIPVANNFAALAKESATRRDCDRKTPSEHDFRAAKGLGVI